MRAVYKISKQTLTNKQMLSDIQINTLTITHKTRENDSKNYMYMYPYMCVYECKHMHSYIDIYVRIV